MKVFIDGLRLSIKETNTLKELILSFYYRDLEKAIKEVRSRKSYYTNLAFKKRDLLNPPKGANPLGGFLGFVFEKFLDKLTVRYTKGRISFRSDFYFKTFEELNKFTIASRVDAKIANIYMVLEPRVFRGFYFVKEYFPHYVFELTPVMQKRLGQEEISLINKVSINTLVYKDIIREYIENFEGELRKKVRKEVKKETKRKIEAKVKIPTKYQKIIKDLKSGDAKKIANFLLKEKIGLTFVEFKKILRFSPRKIYDFLVSLKKKEKEKKRKEDFIEKILGNYGLKEVVSRYKIEHPIKYKRVKSFIEKSRFKMELVYAFGLFLRKVSIRSFLRMVKENMANKSLELASEVMELKKIM